MSSNEATAVCEMALASAPSQRTSLDEERDIAQAVLHRDKIRDLVRALRSLPEEQRDAVLMIGLAKGDYYDVASACKLPVGTIRSRLSRGRKTLRALMSVAPLEPPSPTVARGQLKESR